MSFLQRVLQPSQSKVPDADAIPEGSATHMATEELVSEHRPLRGSLEAIDDEQELEDEVIDIII